MYHCAFDDNEGLYLYVSPCGGVSALCASHATSFMHMTVHADMITCHGADDCDVGHAHAVAPELCRLMGMN